MIQFADIFTVDPAAWIPQFVVLVNSSTDCRAILKDYVCYKTVETAWIELDGKRIPPDQVGYGSLAWAIDDRYVKGKESVDIRISGGFGSEPRRRELGLSLVVKTCRFHIRNSQMTISMPWYRPEVRRPIIHNRVYTQWEEAQPWSSITEVKLETTGYDKPCPRCSTQCAATLPMTICAECFLSFHPEGVDGRVPLSLRDRLENPIV